MRYIVDRGKIPVNMILIKRVSGFWADSKKEAAPAKQEGVGKVC